MNSGLPLFADGNHKILCRNNEIKSEIFALNNTISLRLLGKHLLEERFLKAVQTDMLVLQCLFFLKIEQALEVYR